jgi:SNF2 family DNA or RNA helicase
MVIQNVLKQMLRLSQITSGFYVADQMVDDYGEVLQEKEIHRLDPNPKIEALFELIKDRPKTSKAIIWCCWKQTVRTIVARMEYEKLGYVVYTGDTSDHDRAIAEDKFNGDYNTQYFIGIRAAGGVGLNLLGQANDFTNCEGVINVERNWSYKEEAQADDRSHRRGTRVPVTYTSLLVPDSIDEQQYDRIREKRDTAYSVQDVRELLGKLASSIGKLRE